jgi:sortase (surface protein transpeptidase)
VTTGAIPVALTIAAIDLGAEVTPMGWELAMDGDQITTRWVVPLETLGWAVNSATAGAPGNVVILGHQALGDALLRPLALGEVLPGQEIRLQATDGTTHLYTVSEVSPPIPAIGATAEENARSAAYLAPASTARLTLVSGWPADTTTHRVFVVADYTGVAP